MYKSRLGDVINSCYPVFWAFVLSILFYKLHFTYEVKGFSEVLTSIITFVSIIIAFYTSMYGILITIKNSRIMRMIRQNKVEKLFKYQLYESLFLSFIVLVLSIIMQISMNYEGDGEKILFYVWLFLIVYFAFCTYRIIKLLLKIVFINDAQERASKDQKSEVEKRQQLQHINELNKNSDIH